MPTGVGHPPIEDFLNGVLAKCLDDSRNESGIERDVAAPTSLDYQEGQFHRVMETHGDDVARAKMVPVLAAKESCQIPNRICVDTLESLSLPPAQKITKTQLGHRKPSTYLEDTGISKSLVCGRFSPLASRSSR